MSMALISQKYNFFALIFLFAGIFALFALPVFAQNNGIIQCGGPTQPACTICDIPVTIDRLIDTVIQSFVLPVAILMVVVGGFMMLTAGPSPQRYETGKTILTNTLIGIIFVFFSWTIVNTIIVAIAYERGGIGEFQGVGKLIPWNKLPPSDRCPLGGSGGQRATMISPAPLVSSPPWAPQRRLVGSHVVECSGSEQCACDGEACTVFPSTIVPLKPFSAGVSACAGQSSGYCYVSPELERQLKNLQTGLIQSGAGDQMWVTEAWPPTRIHLNACHQEARCVDMNFKPGQVATVPRIANVISKADASGLRAVYEVKTNTEMDALVRQGVPAGNIQVVSQITGPHFSVYQK